MIAFVFFLLTSPLANGLKLYTPDGSAIIHDVDAEKTARSLSKDGKKAWIMFEGDSNMRHTYYWWVTQQLAKNSERIVKSKTFSLEGHGWPDQEAIVEFPDGFETRCSFRFLHGSDSEFQFKMTNYHNVSAATMYSYYDDAIKKTQLKVNGTKELTNFTMDDPDAIVPSKFAQWAANQKMTFINFEKEAPKLALRFKEYSNQKPDAVILTEGWGGMPACGRFDETLNIMKKNPEVKFVWAPIFVTNHQEKRYQCFAKKRAKTELPANLNYIDNWDLVQKHLSVQGTTEMQNEKHPELELHIGLGGKYMRKGVARFMTAVR